MKRLSAIAAFVILAAGCSANASPIATEPPTTTSPQGKPRIVAGDMIGLPNDSADLAIGRLLLGILDEMRVFVEFQEPPEMNTIGDLIDAFEEYRPLVAASLDRMAEMNAMVGSFLGNDSVSASQDNLQDLTDEFAIWIEGQRAQNDPNVICVPTIPASTYEQPIERLGEQTAYWACFTEFLESRLVSETARAGERFNELLKIVYDETIAG